MRILHVSRRLTQKPQTKSRNQWVPNRFIMANVVIQAMNEQEITELDELASDVEKKTYIADYDMFLERLSKIGNTDYWQLSGEEPAKSMYAVGYETRTPSVESAKQKGVYFYRQYLCDTPAVLAMLDELYLMMTLKDGYPGTREVANHRIITLLKALDLFWD